MKTIQEIAREAGFSIDGKHVHRVYGYELEAFAALVEAAAREDERQIIIAKNAPEIERVNEHLKNLEHQAARYAVLREWEFDGLNSPESVDKAVDDCIGENK